MSSLWQTSSPSSLLLLHDANNYEHFLLSPPSLPPPSVQDGPLHADIGPLNIRIMVGDGNERCWPSDYHVVDIAGCLCECSGQTALKENWPHTQEAVFEEFFPMAHFVPVTFTNQKKLW